MGRTYPNAWNENDDIFLGDTVLRHIKAGSTQQAAFIEVGEKLMRTPEACSFRFNTVVRPKIKSEIDLAKKAKVEMVIEKEKLRQKEIKDSTAKEDQQLTSPLEIKEIETVVKPTLDSIMHDIKSLIELNDNSNFEQENKKLREENENLRKRCEELENKINEVTEVFDKLKQMSIK